MLPFPNCKGSTEDWEGVGVPFCWATTVFYVQQTKTPLNTLLRGKSALLGTLWHLSLGWIPHNGDHVVSILIQFSLCKINIKSLHSTFTTELGILHRVFSTALVTEFWQLFSCAAFSLSTSANLSCSLVCSRSGGDRGMVQCRWRAVTVNTKIIKERWTWVSDCNMSRK